MIFKNIKLGEDELLEKWICESLSAFSYEYEVLYKTYYQQKVEANLNHWLYYGYEKYDQNGLPEILCTFTMAVISGAMPFYMTSFAVQKDHRNLGNGKKWLREFLTKDKMGIESLKEGLYLDCNVELLNKFWSKLGFKAIGSLTDKDFICKYVGNSIEP